MREGRYLGDDPSRGGQDDANGRHEQHDLGEGRGAGRPGGDGAGHGLGEAEGGTVLDQAGFSYDGWSNVASYWQDVDSGLGGSGDDEYEGDDDGQFGGCVLRPGVF